MSLAKLKSFLPFTSSDSLNHRHSKSTGFMSNLDPEVGFQLTLCSKSSDSNAEINYRSVPELHVNIIGARHLPSIFGLKTVEGYVIKVRLTFSCVLRDGINSMKCIGIIEYYLLLLGKEGKR